MTIKKKTSNPLFIFIHLVYVVTKLLMRILQRNTHPSFACIIQNLFSVCIGSKSRFSFDTRERLYCVLDDNLKRYFSEMDRGFSSYERGVCKIGQLLFESYCLQYIKFTKGDVVVDCGANYGDLFLELSSHINENDYVTFEPGPMEHKCLQKSIPYAKHYNLGLSNEKGSLDFYLSSNAGDSSFMEPVSYTSKITVEVTTLDQFMRQSGFKRIKLLKLEAEGWEPEIVDGADFFLKQCEFVAIDGGPERGKECEHTFPYLNNKLCELGFQMVDLVGARHRALYKRVNPLDSPVVLSSNGRRGDSQKW